MAVKNIQYRTTEQKPHGDAILERFGAMTLPKELKPYLATFRAAHTELGAKQKLVVATKQERDAQVTAVMRADAEHDTAVMELGNDLIGARLGTRQRPFADYSEHRPSDLVNLPYKKQIIATRALTKAVLAKKPIKPVVLAANHASAAASGLEKAITGLAKPQAAYAKALAARDALLPDWALAMDRLRRKCIGVWAEDPSMVDTLFAEPSAMEAGKTKRPRKKATGEPKPE